jgi:hypothetical protein
MDADVDADMDRVHTAMDTQTGEALRQVTHRYPDSTATMS